MVRMFELALLDITIYNKKIILKKNSFFMEREEKIMGRTYSEKQMLQKCSEALQNPSTFYAQGFVNYRGICPDAKILYTEVVARFLCNNLQQYISGIQPITRDASYCTPTHDGKYDPNSNREEELIAMKMFGASENGTQYEHIGRIIDYQTPLKCRQNDKAGKIDLLAYDGMTLRLLELKKPSTKETMLRCVLEGFTYLRTVNVAKLLEDFKLPDNTIVKASPFIFEKSIPYKEYFEDRPYLKELMRMLDSTPFFISSQGTSYNVFL